MAASTLLEFIDRLFELVWVAAMVASVAVELFDKRTLDVRFVVIDPFAAASALSTLIEEPVRFVLATWLPVTLAAVVASPPSTLIEEVERLVEL